MDNHLPGKSKINMFLSRCSPVGRNSNIRIMGQFGVIRRGRQSPCSGIIGCTGPFEDDLRVDGDGGLDGEGDSRGNQGERYQGE
jgi:hypothetical protein